MLILPRPLTEFFPKDLMREKQAKALNFVQRAIELEYKHIAITLPTGIGKSPAGIAICAWAPTTPLHGRPGGYYLTAQKLLQDQLEGDFVTPPYQCVSLKSAVDYTCANAKNCGLGAQIKPSGCILRRIGGCPYATQKALFVSSHLSVTNYPYFFTERLYARRLPMRQVVICDEAHGLESQIIRFVDISISESKLQEWAPHVQVPRLDELPDFVAWIEESYVPEVKAKLEALILLSEGLDDKMAKLAVELERHVAKIDRAVELIKDDSSQWVYWQEIDNGKKMSIARPLNAAPFASVLFDAADVKIYMSAYLGSKDVFCHSLGLTADQVAWASFGSTFRPENRPVKVLTIGSMSMRNVAQTMPSMLRILEKIMAKHATDKGLLHTSSYRIGHEIFNHFKNTVYAPRLIFPENAEQREAKFKQHVESDQPTILISPSMMEGFDFKDNLARWQAVVKVPWKDLGDKQVKAKMNQDEAWFAMETVKALIQACGRICRSNEDWGITYILDSDFHRLYDRWKGMFPKWLTDAFIWPKGS